jgi:hypothetical protein
MELGHDELLLIHELSGESSKATINQLQIANGLPLTLGGNLLLNYTNGSER